MTENNPVGVVSIQEINDYVYKDKMPNLNKRYLDFDLFVWRCEQYKKYKALFELNGKTECLTEYKMSEKNKLYEDWLFDFVMNGRIDDEKNTSK